jgi:hypothetical protein
MSDKLAEITSKPTRIDHCSNLYRVKIGPLGCANQSDQLKQLLAKNGFDKAVLVTN